MYPKAGVTSRRPGEKKVWRSLNGKRKRKPETAKADLKPRLAVPGGQGVRREAESEGHEEKHRAVIEGSQPDDDLVGRGWGKVEPAVGRRRRSHSPTIFKVIADGTVRKNGA